MKRMLLPPIFVLAALLAFSLWNIRHMEGETNRWREQLQGADQLALSGEWAEALDALLRAEPAVFFSQALCARYFTYRKGGETRFVLFDDAETLRRKLRVARESGIPDALCVYPEVQDLLPRLFPGK